MTGIRTMVVTIVVAVLCIAGIIGMLLVQGQWDRAFFMLATLPLLVGLVCTWRRRPPGKTWR